MRVCQFRHPGRWIGETLRGRSSGVNGCLSTIAQDREAAAQLDQLLGDQPLRVQVDVQVLGPEEGSRGQGEDVAQIDHADALALQHRFNLDSAGPEED